MVSSQSAFLELMVSSWVFLWIPIDAYSSNDTSVDLEFSRFTSVKDERGNALCVRDNPNGVRNVRSMMECIWNCQQTPGCWTVNWKYSHTCELFSSTPSDYSVVDGCRNQAPTLRYCTRIGSIGSYSVNISGFQTTIYCDLSTPGGEWLVFQRRMDGSVDFYRDWTSYRNGFGNKSGEFWLGLDLLSALTSARSYKLRIDLADFNGNHRYAEYSSFTVGSQATNYILNVGSYTGDAGDCLNSPEKLPQIHNGMQFSTFDVDHDTSGDNCAVTYRGAWWYSSCHVANLNGAYLGGPHSTFADGIEWYYWTEYFYSLRFTEMKMAVIQ